ncbi:MAG: hypothetical protein PHW60_13575 [Kiritimatiellae bacterium]|nr:hypothetical protein [Kiritimatiellia bacterium]
MAKRNRRKKTEGFVIALPWVAILMGVVVLMLSYVWLDARGQDLGRRIKFSEKQRAEIQKRYDYELWKWETLKSPSSIEKALAHNRVAMIWPEEGRLVRLQEPELAQESLTSYSRQMAQLSQPSRSVVND